MAPVELKTPTPLVRSNESPQFLRTDAWYTDALLDLTFPSSWDVRTIWPSPPAPLTNHELAECFEHPVGQDALRDLCRGKAKPVIIVDDLNRPTPCGQVLPFVLKHFRDAGIPAGSITVVISTGTHQKPSIELVHKKLGPEAASAARIVIHDPRRNCVNLGDTDAGTPVWVDDAVMAGDFVMGIGGVYPNSTAGFGGGSKLALGVLGFRSIKSLHFRFGGVGWGALPNQQLREELDRIAKLIRLNTIVSLQINSSREIVRATCGDHVEYYSEEVAFARRRFRVPEPGDADVVISNAYPSDLSLTSAVQKGTNPLQRTKPDASRIVIASCPDGTGEHGLFPVVRPRYLPFLQKWRRFSEMSAREFLRAAGRRLATDHSAPVARRPILLYQPKAGRQPIPEIPGYRVLNSWPEVLAKVEQEQGTGRKLKSMIYGCAPLISFDADNPV